METLGIRELSLTDLEDELERVKKAQAITQEFLDNLNSLPKEKINELENFKANLELLKSFEKKESKEQFVIKLKDKKSNLEKAIKHMKDSGDKIYDPRKVKWE